jgi:hypothetical protein
MAEKRMFSRQVISSDTFLDMPAATQGVRGRWNEGYVIGNNRDGIDGKKAL